MNLATFIDTTGMHNPPAAAVGWLGQGKTQELSPEVTAAWENYLRGARNQMADSWNRAREAYLTLKRVREQLGLPFIAPANEAGQKMAASGALSQNENDEFVNAAVIAKFLIDIADQTLAGQRRLVMDNGNVGIELLDSDTMRLSVINGRPTLISVPPTGDKSSGQAIEVNTPSGMVEGVGVGSPWLVGLGIVVVVAVAAYFSYDSYAEKEKTLAEQKTLQTLSETQQEAIKKGATPEQAAKMSAAILDGATALKIAEGEAKKKEEESGIQSTVRTAMWVGLAIAGLFFLAKIIPPTIEAAGPEKEAA